MPAIAHIVHPVVVPPASDLVVAQPVTFETMRIAREFAVGIDVDLYAVQYHDEDRMALPPVFLRTPDLSRSLSDLMPFKRYRKLALIADILEALYQTSRAEYFIYTNVDIAVQPTFYRAVADFISQGYDAFCINRRTISDRYHFIEQLPLMYAEIGIRHPGWDCFVFRRDLLPRFDLDLIAIGTNWIGRAMIANLACLGNRFTIFEDLHLTFHIGDRKEWQAPELDDFQRHNQDRCRRILLAMDSRFGPLDRQAYPGRFLQLLEKMGSL
jgi:hypothetical protein